MDLSFSSQRQRREMQKPGATPQEKCDHDISAEGAKYSGAKEVWISTTVMMANPNLAPSALFYLT